jgi:hypothetical protein
MDNAIELISSEQTLDLFSIADIDIDVGKSRVGQQSFQIPTRAALRAEEDLAHVVVDSDHIRADFIVIADRRRSN